MTQCSVDSMRWYAKYKRLGMPLKCPCNYRADDTLIVTDDINDEVCLVTLERNPLVVSIVCCKDLKRRI